MFKSDTSIEPWPHVASQGLTQSQSNLETEAESREELNLAPPSNAAQTATPSGRMVRGRFRADTATLANWRDEKDPVKRRRLAQNYRNRQSEKRARQAHIDAQNGASTENARELQHAEHTTDQVSQTTGVNFTKGWRNILPAPEKP